MVWMWNGLLGAPLASLEVGEHLYWELGNLKIHGQVFITSWIVMALLIGNS
jgi:F-type H+-transporting ATPase subunit a